MPTHHSSHPAFGLVAMSGVPGGGGPSFEKPAAGSIAPGQGIPPLQGDLPGGPGLPGQPIPPGGAPVPQGGTYELSGWWRRVGATLIDGLILMIPFIPLMLIVFAAFGLSLGGNEGDGSATGFFASLLVGFVLICIYAVVALVYAPYFMSKWNGATPGKRAVGIRVVRADGLPITFGFAALREVVVKQLVFGIAGSFTLGLAQLLQYLWPLWDSEHRALHDLIVNTRVVRG